MEIFNKKIELKISTKVALSFIILVLLQGIISLITLTAIISRSQDDSFKTQMNRAFSGIEGYLDETLNELIVNTNLLAGQKKIIDYTDFGLKNLLKRELSVFKSSLSIDAIGIYLKPHLLFTSEGHVLVLKYDLKKNLKQAFSGEKAYFISESGDQIMLTVLSPIKREKNIIGIIGLNLNIDQAFVRKIENISNARVIILFNGKCIDSGNLSRETIAKINSFYKNQSVKDDVVKINGFMVGSISMAAIGEPDGKIFCLLDTLESRLLITRYNTISLVSTLLILSLALVIGIIFYRVTFLQPFQNLLKGVFKISEGDLHYRFQVPAQDEFGELASAFNKMRVNLLSRERELLQLSHYNTLIFENVRAGIITVNLKSEITTLNPAAEATIGKDAKALKGSSINSKDLPQNLFSLIGECLNNDINLTGKEVRINQDGNDRILSLSTSPMFSKDGAKIGTIAIIEDITRVKKLEEKLLISSRLAALGEMAAGVAHQVRNPLTVMKVSSEMLRDNYTVVEKKKAYDRITHMLINEIDTLNLVVSNLLDFARPREIQKSLCPIKDVIQSSLDSLPLDKYPELEINTYFKEEIPKYSLDKSLIEQVISNLVLNAIQASSSDDRIDIRVFMENSNLCLEIEDSGCGFNEETRKQIFNPFFTTKKTGTGLGLSIAHRIIEQHGGTIDVQSSPGKGSIFRIVF